MKQTLAHVFWVFSNWWGWAFGWPMLAPLNKAFLNLHLHALGHDNPRFTGESRFIKHTLKKEDVRVCFDVGGNVGNYSKDLLTELNCKVYAFEPLSSSYEELALLSKKYPEKLIPFRVALGDFNGDAVIEAKEEKSEKASINIQSETKGRIKEKILVTTLDTFVKQHSIERIDFIKIDTEGFEREVIEGMQETLSRIKPRYIQFEFNIGQLERGYTVLDLHKLLNGYSFYRLLPHGLLKINTKTFGANVFVFQNIVAIREN